MENETTTVIFRRWPKSEGGDVLALFPEEPGTYDDATCTSYQHVGQHASADPVLCINATESASLADPDVAELKRELEARGYRLAVRYRLSRRMREIRRKVLAHYA